MLDRSSIVKRNMLERSKIMLAYAVIFDYNAQSKVADNRPLPLIEKGAEDGIRTRTEG